MMKISLFSTCLASILLASSVQAQHWLLNQRITAGGGRGNEFGHGVAIDGDNIIGAAPFNSDENDDGVGGIAFFRRDRHRKAKYQLASFLRVNDPVADSQLGYNSVGISGDLAIAGAPEAENGVGAAYIFSRNAIRGTWAQQAKIQFPDTSTGGERFGVSVDIVGTTAVIGASFAQDQGAAYVYTQTEGGTAWNLQHTLVADDAAGEPDNFGASVSLGENATVVAIGSPQDTLDTNSKPGSAFIFTYDENLKQFNQTIKLNGTDSESGDRFGQSVATNGDRVVVGAGQHKLVGGDSSGAAYVYQKVGDEWAFETKLTASDSSPGDVFGFSVAIDNDQDIIIVGAYADDERGSNSGSAYAHRLNGEEWSQDKIFKFHHVGSDENYGESVSVSNGVVIIGAWSVDDRRNEDDQDVGEAYIYEYRCKWYQIICQIFHGGQAP